MENINEDDLLEEWILYGGDYLFSEYKEMKKQKQTKTRVTGTFNTLFCPGLRENLAEALNADYQNRQSKV